MAVPAERSGTSRAVLGSLDEELAGLVRAFQSDHPGCEVRTVEMPLADPFGPVLGGDVDAAIVLTPVREPGLAVGPRG